MYENKVMVFDDIIDMSEQNVIREELIGWTPNQFPWHFIEDITNDNKSIQKRPAFQHTLVKNSTIMSKYAHWLLPIARHSEEKIGFQSSRVEHVRTFLQLPLNTDKTIVDTPHVDLNYKHLVVLYYVNTSDGDTIIYNQKEETKEYTIKQKVTPKQGRVVIFDGRFYHTAEQPSKDIRCVINFNLI